MVKSSRKELVFQSEEAGNDITMDQATDVEADMDMLGEELACFQKMVSTGSLILRLTKF